MSRAVDDLLQILDLERLEINLFRGNSPQVGWQRVFGGQVIGQALVAACRTVEGREPHSLHAYFLLGGDPKVPIIYEVDRIRDGRSFTTRRVIAIQHGQPIFSMSVSFHVREPGLEHAVPMPKVPGPEELPSEAEIKATVMPMMPDPVRAYYERERPIELRPVEFDRYLSREPKAPKFNVWIRTTGRLPDDPAIHQCVLAYASDMTLLDSALIAHGRTVFERSIQAASLDHALWFHRPFRADDWLLYAQDSPEHLRRPRLLPRPDLRPRRHPRRLGRAGRPDPPARGPRLSAKTSPERERSSRRSRPGEGQPSPAEPAVPCPASDRSLRKKVRCRFAAACCAGSRVAFRLRCMRPGKQWRELRPNPQQLFPGSLQRSESGVEGYPGPSAIMCEAPLILLSRAAPSGRGGASAALLPKF